MLDSLSMQLREAETRRTEIERAHQETLAQIRNLTSSGRHDAEAIENLQSRARELEKKVALENVRCEELQIELSATLKAKAARSNAGTSNLSSGVGSSAAGTMAGTSSTVTWAPTIGQQDQGSEIDIIMAKIEQDNRVLAELEHPRTSSAGISSMPTSSILSTGNSEFKTISKNELEEELNRYKRAVLGGTSGTSTTGLTSGSIIGSSALPSSLTQTGLHNGNTLTGASTGLTSMSTTLLPNSIGGMPSSLSSHALQSMNTYGAGSNSVEKLLSGTSGITGIPQLPVNIHTMKSMPSALSQSTTMPILSLNSHNIPTGSGSYSALGLSGTGTGSSGLPPTLGTSLTHPTIGNMLDTSVLLGTNLGLSGTGGVPGTSSLYGLGSTGLSGLPPGLPNSYPLPFLDAASSASYPFTSAALSNVRKMKMLDEIDIPLTRFGNRSSPCSPIPPSAWGLDEFTDSMGASMLHNRSGLALGALDLDNRNHALNGASEPQVDMLDIPGKGRCCVFIARFPYDPPEDAEGELSLCAGDYLLVWTSGEPQGGYLDAELLDGRRGLVPASFVQRLIGDDLLEFHQAVLSTLRDAEDGSMQCDTTSLPSLPPHNPLLTHTQEDLARLSETHTDLEHDQDDISDNVPAPKHLTLERQLNKSVLIGWSPPEPVGYNLIDSYHVYVDGVLKVTVKANERTRALIEGVDSTRPHRISVRSVTQNRQTSRDAACTMIIGRDTAHLGPSAVRASHITCSSAVISWLPANSNHQHVVCVNNVEVRTVKPGVYRHTITGLAPSTQYRVTVRAKHLRAPGGHQTPGRPQEEAPGAYADFRTLTKGLPDPPQDIQLEAGPQDGTILVTWQPVNRPTSSGPVTGYAVYADGKKVTDINSPTGDHALIDIGKLGVFNPRAVTIRTKSRDSQSADSAPILIPNTVRNAVGRRGPTQMGMGSAQLPQGSHMMPGQIGLMPGQQTQQQQQHMMLGQDPSQYDPNQPMQQQPGMQHSVQQQPGQQGQQVYGDKDADGFYWGELRGRRGYVPHNMVTEVDDGTGTSGGMAQIPGVGQPGVGGPGQIMPGQSGTQQSMRNVSRDRWGDIYANMPVKRMIALYDYDPQELSPNVDAEQVELSFKTGEIILVYGDMDEDGFYMGELDGVRGLVPSNFLAEAPDQYNNQMMPGGGMRGGLTQQQRGRGQGPGARGPPPPPRDNMMPGVAGQRGPQGKNARPASPTLLDNTGHPAPDHQTQGMIGRVGNVGMQQQQPYGQQQQTLMGQQQQQLQQQQMGMGQMGQSSMMGQQTQQQIGAPMMGQQQLQQPSQQMGMGMGLGSMSQQQHQPGQQQMGMGASQQQQQMGMNMGVGPMGQQQPGQQQMPPVTTQSGGLFSGATSLLSGATSAATGGLFGSKQPPKMDPMQPPGGAQPMQQQQVPPQAQQPTQGQGPGAGLLGGLKGIAAAAPGGDVLSKGKDLFGKFGFGFGK